MSTPYIKDLLARDFETQKPQNLTSDDYYNRSAIILTEPDRELNHLVTHSKNKLYQLEMSCSNLTMIDLSNVQTVIDRLNFFETTLQNLSPNDSQREFVQQRINVLSDLRNLFSLERIQIQLNDNHKPIYCTLAESAGGVTEKISLISIKSAKKQLTNLIQADPLDIATYSKQRPLFHLPIEAIIKLPKNGLITEIQRESMALNLSRLLGGDTTQSFSLNYNNLPALFVPFDDIQLLTEFSTGVVCTANLGFFGSSYINYSTIKALGNGLQPNYFVDDFGHALGLLYLCSDTDAIGGHCQNKALKNAKTLYIFDQILMNENKFILDSRLSLQPAQWVMKHTRHGQGRNRSLIEDSSMNTKFTSIMQLINKKETILQYIQQISATHATHIKQIDHLLKNEDDAAIRTKLNNELLDVQQLKKDAESFKISVEERIQKINDILPNGKLAQPEQRQLLILEKLLNMPVLFTEDGRPYKYPWTDRNNITLQSVINQNNNTLQLHFSSQIDIDLYNYLKKQCKLDSMTITYGKILNLSRSELPQINEFSLHPELKNQLILNDSYLDTNRLNLLLKAYNLKTSPLLTQCKAYRDQLLKTPLNDDKINLILNTEIELTQLAESVKEQGFAKHILKLFHLDAQVELRKCIGKNLPPNLNKAFAAALALDRIIEFNALIAVAIICGQLSSPQLNQFFDECISKHQAATNFYTAAESSQTVAQLAKSLSEQFLKASNLKEEAQPVNSSKFLCST